MKNKELLEISNKLNSIKAEDLEGFPVDAIYAIYKNRDRANAALAPYNATRDAIIRKYKPDGKITKEDEHFAEALAEISELAEIDTDEPLEIRVVSFRNLETLSISPQLMEKLVFMIED